MGLPRFDGNDLGLGARLDGIRLFDAVAQFIKFDNTEDISGKGLHCSGLIATSLVQ